MPLTETQIRNLKPESTPKKHFDGEGLFLYVTPAGSKLWRMAYRFEGKAKLLSFGKYPIVSLRDARARRDEAKSLLDKGVDPSAVRKQQKQEREAVAVLEELRLYSGEGKYLFPSIRTDVRPISEVTMLNALRRMGYEKDEMSVHGFRSLASTLLNERGYNRDWIERQLAHSERNGVRAAYNYAEYLPERRRMMQEWADYLDELKNAA